MPKIIPLKRLFNTLCLHNMCVKTKRSERKVVSFIRNDETDLMLDRKIKIKYKNINLKSNTFLSFM